jgi:hypothetical protein
MSQIPSYQAPVLMNDKGWGECPHEPILNRLDRVSPQPLETGKWQPGTPSGPACILNPET